MILSSEDINLLETDPEYQRAIDSTEPTIYTGSAYGFRTLYYNIRINDVCVGRICLDEKDAPITGRDYLTVRVLGTYVKKKLAKDKIYEFNRPKDLDMILTYLLDHHFLPEQRIQAILNSYGWHMDDQYA
ncbi:MAG TPA: hypothetical protein DF613_15395 [Lachnospiraceae bacterium]|nr:hypothetical protein [Lachnospiraceae bacterium]